MAAAESGRAGGTGAQRVGHWWAARSAQRPASEAEMELQLEENAPGRGNASRPPHGSQLKAERALGRLEAAMPWDRLSGEQTETARKALGEARAFVARVGGELQGTIREARQSNAEKEVCRREVEAAREKEEEAARRAKGAPWRPDSARDACADCAQPFSWTNWRHHCRHCGDLFDAACCDKYMPLPELGYCDPVRVCRGCFRAKREPAPSTSSATPSRAAAAAATPTPTPTPTPASSRAAKAVPGPSGLRNSLFLAQLQTAPKLRSTSGTADTAASPVAATSPKPKTVLDELRRSLKKRNSCPHMRRRCSEDVDSRVAQNIAKRKHRLAGEAASLLQPRKGTAIATFLDSPSAVSRTSGSRSDDEWL